MFLEDDVGGDIIFMVVEEGNYVIGVLRFVGVEFLVFEVGEEGIFDLVLGVFFEGSDGSFVVGFLEFGFDGFYVVYE